jgi:elongation factor P hydroxylase
MAGLTSQNFEVYFYEGGLHKLQHWQSIGETDFDHGDFGIFAFQQNQNIHLYFHPRL